MLKQTPLPYGVPYTCNISSGYFLFQHKTQSFVTLTSILFHGMESNFLENKVSTKHGLIVVNSVVKVSPQALPYFYSFYSVFWYYFVFLHYLLYYKTPGIHDYHYFSVSHEVEY